MDDELSVKAKLSLSVQPYIGLFQSCSTLSVLFKSFGGSSTLFLLLLSMSVLSNGISFSEFLGTNPRMPIRTYIQPSIFHFTRIILEVLES
jgi:hypothetical protein